MPDKLVSRITRGLLAEILGECGWKVTLEGNDEAPRIASAVNGVNFNIHFGTRCTDGDGWTDFTVSAPFAIDEEISSVLGAFWNRRNRFARVYRTDKQLLIEMDVIVAGGVSRDHLKYQFAVWNDLTTLFLRHLKADHAVLARQSAARAAGLESAGTAPITLKAIASTPVGTLSA
ncbi:MULTISPECIES: YbjN domain-containing protein [unclassified Mesorhizobium]|uniref:YbjN domain-containing protein n=1 Tax=unclassified Mesorhizobium TaxID=325217 RepID=UPI003014B6D6